MLYGDVSRQELIEKLDLDQVKAVVLTMDDPVLTARVAKRLRAEHPALPIIARARDTRSCRRPLPRRRDRRGAGSARGIAAAERGRAGRHRRRHGPGDRLDPRKAQRASRIQIMEAGQLEVEPSLGRRRVRDSKPARLMTALRRWQSLGCDLLQRLADRLQRFLGLRAVRAAALGHVGHGRRRPARPAPRPRP